MHTKTIGIMGAMPEEISSITELLSGVSVQTIGGREYYSGILNGIQVVVVFSRWGKVAAATTVTTLILEFQITELIFTGVAGAIHPGINIGDVVIGKRLVQHDLDARPIMPRFEIPLLHISFIECEPQRLLAAETVINDLFSAQHLQRIFDEETLTQFNIHAPKVLTGDIASGDKFFAGHEAKQQLLETLPHTLCVEMEGAAVAQVCYEYGIPFTILRTISDTADEDAAIDFHRFITHISSKYAREIIQYLVQ